MNLHRRGGLGWPRNKHQPEGIHVACSAGVVTNQTVVDMVAAKLPADVIVTKIQTSKTQFDLSTAALVKLNESGVPSEVVKAMMQKSNEPAAGAPSKCALCVCWGGGS